jgi:CheY-like chemotaxis protein
MNGHRVSAGADLSTVRVLVVEDESIVSFLAEDMLMDLGCREVWHAGSVGKALDLLDERRPDVALLDVNLGGELVYPVAEKLTRNGIPIVFTTGYGRRGLATDWSTHPVIAKPFGIGDLAAGLISALGA